MQLFNSTSNPNNFELNGLTYPKNFMSIKQAATNIAVHNVYDTKQQLLGSTHYSQISVNGITYNSQAELMAALSNVLFAKQFNFVVQNAEATKLVSVGNISLSGNNLTIQSAQWLINSVTYSTLTETHISVPFASSGKTRIDLIVGNSAYQIQKISGSETNGIAVAPTTPVDSVYITQMLISDNAVGTPNTPVINRADVFVSGGTFSAGTTTFTNTTGGTFSITGYTSGYSGTTNRIPKLTSGSTFINSNFSDNGTSGKYTNAGNSDQYVEFLQSPNAFLRIARAQSRIDFALGAGGSIESQIYSSQEEEGLNIWSEGNLTISSGSNPAGTTPIRRFHINRLTGNVNIGSGTTPTEKLQVNGNLRVTGGYLDSTNSSGSTGQYLKSTGTGTTWSNLSNSFTGGTISGITNFTNGLNVSGASLTLSGASSILDLTQTWNTTGTPSAIKLNVNDTASNAASKLIDLQVGNVSKFSVGKLGNVTLPSGDLQTQLDNKPSANDLYYLFDCEGVPITTQFGNVGNFYISKNGTTPPAVVAQNAPTIDPRNQGVWYFKTATGANNYVSIGTGQDISSLISLRLGQGEFIYETFIHLDSITSGNTNAYAYFTGLFDQGAVTNGVLFAFEQHYSGVVNTPSINWQCATVSGGSKTITNTGIPATLGWIKLGFTVNASNTSVGFYINGNLVATHTTNLPTGRMGVMSYLNNRNIGIANAFYMDYMKYWYKGIR